MEKRTVMLVLNDQDGLEHTTTLIDIMTALPTAEIIPAIEAACRGYLNTPEGRKQYSDNCGNFNFGDFDMYVGNEYCAPHGFTKISDATFEVIDEDFNRQLGEPDENEGEGFILDEPFQDVDVTGEDIDDIMDSAMSGCTYWCRQAEVLEYYRGEYASEQISRGGEIKFHPEYDDEPVVLDREKFRKGLNRWLKGLHDRKDARLEKIICENAIDPGMIDAGDADTILQYALFDELIYC